jgi:hypothetical protein
MGSRFCSLLLSLARLFVGYPASLLADALDTVRFRHHTLFDLLVRVPVRQAAAHLAPRNDAELTLMGLMVAVLAFTLALWLLPVWALRLLHMQQVAGPEPVHDDTEQVSAADRRLRQGILAIFRSHHIRAGQVLMAHQVNLQFLTDGRTAADYAAGLSYALEHGWLEDGSGNSLRLTESGFAPMWKTPLSHNPL